ncbi:MAG TPA: phosphotransferase [Actinomycetota bacterium]|jgi:aminoglycoside phosphotransferase (APT) family kinase protein|nr:phosphotransferase [Actinomycetota bacterium]
MPEELELIAQGRAADVFAYGDGRVLRRYRTEHDVSYEADVMRYVHEHGYPVPTVIAANGRDMVMERLSGTPMLEDFSKHPWRLYRHARTLADLHKQLHAIPPPPWLKPKLGGGTAIVHLDLHPLNVMVTDKGPVVIDWSNAGLGPPDAETADLWLLMSNADIPGSGVVHRLIRWGRGLFLRAFMKHVDKTAVRKHLRLAAAARMKDRNMTEAEIARMRAFVERWALD